MIALLYLPALALIHFASGAALGGLVVLSGKAVCDMRAQDCRSAKQAPAAS